VGRWEPDARGRLLQAALDLFTDQGYEATTAAQIAERAGLTKTTLFRLFADKREILFQGQPVLVSIATAGVLSAADDASAVEMLRCGLIALCKEHVPEQQDIGRRINLLIAVSPELQERATFKRSMIAAALEAALVSRLVDRRSAGALSDLGVRAYYQGFADWANLVRTDSLLDLVLDEFESLQAAVLESLGT
jgi:AcrR family transcriptional regulator